MKQMDGDRVLSHVRAINRTVESPQVLAAFQDAIADYGFKHAVIGQLINPASVHAKQSLFLSTWPEELMEQRSRSMAIVSDPIARTALRTRKPFRWSQAIRMATVAGKRVANQVRDYGISDGIMFPMHSMDSVTGGVSLGAERLDASPSEIAELELICSATYFRFEAIEGPFPYQLLPTLSPRETEVVQLAAAGKTNRDIADILGLKEDTVKKHMSAARAKLGALNRAHAVSKAIASSQIFP